VGAARGGVREGEEIAAGRAAIRRAATGSVVVQGGVSLDARRGVEAGPQYVTHTGGMRLRCDGGGWEFDGAMISGPKRWSGGMDAAPLMNGIRGAGTIGRVKADFFCSTLGG
jgi:hypothetical protein